MDECVHGYYGNRVEADCQPCEGLCETCSETPTNCTSCKLPPAGEPITKFYYNNECIDECPPGWLADVDNRDNVCKRCNENCATCSGSDDRCSTCKAGYKLNTLDQTCVLRCPAGITVETVDPV